MKSKLFIKAPLLVIGIMLVGSPASAQGIFDRLKNQVKEKVEQADKVKEKISTAVPDSNRGNLPDGNFKTCEELIHATPTSNLAFARLEVSASWIERGRKIYETRVYYSKLLSLPRGIGSYNYKAQLISYFNEGVVEQLKQRGIEINYYENQVQIFPHSYSYDSPQDAQADMDKKIEADKSNERAIYSFVWKFGAKNVGKDVTQPRRVFGIKPPPAKEAEKIAVDAADLEREIKRGNSAATPN